MRVYYAMALCTWRDDWPPNADIVRFGIYHAYKELIDFSRPFRCTQPPEGPEELQCQTELNITHGVCTRYHTQLHETPISVNIQHVNANTFSLCRLDLYCNARMHGQGALTTGERHRMATFHWKHNIGPPPHQPLVLCVFALCFFALNC